MLFYLLFLLVFLNEFHRALVVPLENRFRPKFIRYNRFIDKLDKCILLCVVNELKDC